MAPAHGPECQLARRNRRFHRFSWALLLAQGALSAQAPILEDEAEALRQKEIQWAILPWLPLPPPATDHPWGFHKMGMVALSSTDGAWVPLSQGQGLGTTRSGTGMALALGGRSGGLEFAATVLFLDDPKGTREGHLHTGHLAYQTRNGWRFALENSPMKWGYGPLGGHLLGMSAPPFPKARITTRVFEPSLGGRGLGRWHLDGFLGQLERHRTVPQWQGSYLGLSEAARQRGGLLSRPYQSGWKINAEFAETIQISFGVTSMWGGLLPDGTDRMKGLHWLHYPMAALGGENTLLAEAEKSNVADPSYYRALSNGIGSFDIRIRNRLIANLFRAEGAYWYYERSGENINWQWKTFLRNPIRAIAHDVAHPRNPWNNGTWAAVPSFSLPTHAWGLQIHWPSWQLGAEVRDSATHQSHPFAYQTYQSATYLGGHSREGDSLGILFGGTYLTGTLALDWQPREGLRLRGLLAQGARGFVDDATLWAQAHPAGLQPQRNILRYAEFGFSWALSGGWEAGGTLGLKHEIHPSYEPGSRSSYSVMFSLGKALGASRRHEPQSRGW
ncbi:MAG TPA: hypothetical protein VFV26_01110 [Geothrix sp.]|jgi:hypothetical protein|nr:hypothetical protein [Geothrix sp.]